MSFFSSKREKPSYQTRILESIYLEKKWITVKSISEKIGLTFKQVEGQIKHLINRGLIIKKIELEHRTKPANSRWMGELYVKARYLKCVENEKLVKDALKRGFKRDKQNANPS